MSSDELVRKFDAACAALYRGDKKPSQTTTLVELLLEAGVQLFHSSEQEAYVELPVTGHREIWPIRSKMFRRWAARQFYDATGNAIRAQAIQDALLILEARALYEGDERCVLVRVAEQNGCIYIDLANEAWQVVRVTSHGWDVLDESEIAFRRTKGMAPLPIPQRGGSLESLRHLLSINDEGTWQLLVAWLVASLRPRGPYPVLVIQGEQGTGKSWTARTLRSLIDPNIAGLRVEPRDVRDLMIAATNGWILAFDNLSRIEPWFSDGLCRLATGGALATRELYSDTDETILEAQRPVVLTSIEEITTRGDLIDRALLIQLEQISETSRREERVLEQELDRLRPLLFGSLLDGVVSALANINKVSLPQLPRMADFATWITAAERGLGWKLGSFMEAYGANGEHAMGAALDSSPIFEPLQNLITAAERNGKWVGTAALLLEALEGIASNNRLRQRGWPKSPKSLSNQLRRLAPNLRKLGISVEFGRDSTKTRTRLIHIEQRDVSASEASESSGSFGLSDTPSKENTDVPSVSSSLNTKRSDALDDTDATKHSQSLGEEILDLDS